MAAEQYLDFFKGKRVFITGHTGFKGSWMWRVLSKAGANLMGYALEPPTDPSLFDIIKDTSKGASVIGDIRDFENLKKHFDEFEPEIVIHMAAQPLVLESYKKPAYTYETNVMGTVNILECVRSSDSVKSFLNVTTDKVYENREWLWGYRENDILNGFDPYSNSKSCSDLITGCYKNSYFTDDRVSISVARAGNVIGGGDFAKDRIIPDCIRAAVKGENIAIRNPYSTRPYQHVLEPVMGYLTIAERQYADRSLSGAYNIGPLDDDCVTTGDLASLFCKIWAGSVRWENKCAREAPHEAGFLKLDISKMRHTFGWRPVWSIEEAVEKTIEWAKAYLYGSRKELLERMDSQIEEFIRRKPY